MPGKSVCFTCGSRDHGYEECAKNQQVEDKGGIKLYDTCRRPSCNKCGSEEHIRANCKLIQKEQDFKSWQCFHCHEKGHIMKKCPKITCFKCGRKGHTARFCPAA